MRAWLAFHLRRIANQIDPQAPASGNISLREYIRANSSVTEFAKRIGKSRAQVHRYLLGRNLTMDVIERIREATSGAVSPADFFSSEPTTADVSPETKDAA
jgi:transcriptional regulator with XRE-family HTH domain